MDSFADADKISNFAAESVEAMRQTGILNGRSQGDGTYRFDPKNSTTRGRMRGGAPAAGHQPSAL